MELPTSNRKKVIDIWLTGLVAKIDPFSIFSKVISRKSLDLHRWKSAQIFFQALSSSVPNFIEIGGGSRKFSKKLVDLTRNDPSVSKKDHARLQEWLLLTDIQVEDDKLEAPTSHRPNVGHNITGEVISRIAQSTSALHLCDSASTMHLCYLIVCQFGRIKHHKQTQFQSTTLTGLVNLPVRKWIGPSQLNTIQQYKPLKWHATESASDYQIYNTKID